MGEKSEALFDVSAKLSEFLENAKKFRGAEVTANAVSEIQILETQKLALSSVASAVIERLRETDAPNDFDLQVAMTEFFEVAHDLVYLKNFLAQIERAFQVFIEKYECSVEQLESGKILKNEFVDNVKTSFETFEKLVYEGESTSYMRTTVKKILGEIRIHLRTTFLLAPTNSATLSTLRAFFEQIRQVLLSEIGRL